MHGRTVFSGILAILLVLALLGGLAYLQGPPPSAPRREKLEQPLGATTTAESGAAGGAGKTAASGHGTEAGRRTESAAVGAAPGSGTNPLEVFVDLEAGEFEIVPAGVGKSILVEADYDETMHRLEHEFLADAAHGDRFRLSFTTRGPWRHLRRAVGEATGRGRSRDGRGRATRVRVELPVGVPMALHLHLAKGSARIDLTGLSLRRLVLDQAMGDADLVLKEPNPVEMEELDVHAKMGDVTLSGLGHAHTRRLDFGGSMGSYELDFDGPWAADLEGSINITMGNAVVDVPSEVILELANRRVVLGSLETSAARSEPGPEKKGRRLVLQTAVHFGNLSIR